MTCTYAELDRATVLVDPLVPDEERDRFFAALDADVERRDVPVAILLCAPQHRRSAEELAERYGALTWNGEGELPDGVRTFHVAHPRPLERPLWLEPLRALVFGDALLTFPGELRVWWGDDDWYREHLLPSLRPLAELPAEHVIVGHGPPVAGEELARALDRPPYS